MITLTDIAYVRSGVADLDAATRFATEIVGLELAAPTEAGRRAPARRPPPPLPGPGRGPVRGHRLRLHRGRYRRARRRGNRTRAFRADRAPRLGRARRGPGASASSSPSTTRSATGSSWSASRSSSPGRWRSAAPAGITEFGHLCLDAPDVHEAYRFWSTRFNARVSDWIGDAACLMRIDPVHHKLAVFRGDDPGLCHMNFQVATVDDLFRNWHFLQDHEVEIEMGPGRHPQSTAIFLYFLGPEGFTYEYSFGVRRIEDEASWVPRTFDPAEPGSIDMWLGPTTRPITQPQVRSGQPAGIAGALS